MTDEILLPGEAVAWVVGHDFLGNKLAVSYGRRSMEIRNNLPAQSVTLETFEERYSSGGSGAFVLEKLTDGKNLRE